GGGKQRLARQLGGAVVGDRQQRADVLGEQPVGLAVDRRRGGEGDRPRADRLGRLDGGEGGLQGAAKVDRRVGGAGGDVAVGGQVPDDVGRPAARQGAERVGRRPHVADVGFQEREARIPARRGQVRRP